MAGKFNSARDEFLHQLTLDGTDRSGGHVEAPTGFYTLVSIRPGDVQTLRAEHPDIDAATIGEGQFLVTEDSDGFVTVNEYPDEDSAIAAFEALEAKYSDWDDE